MTALAVPARAAFERVLESIRANSNHPKVHDATFQLEVLSAALWPEKDERVAALNRWEGYGLTALERKLADLLVQNLGKIVTTDQFMNHCYFDRPDNGVPSAKLFQVKVCHLRKKLKASPYRIVTEWGIGYRMVLKPT